jgi:hypothetical protein
MAREKKDMFADFKENVLNNKVETPMQSVNPVKIKKGIDEKPFNVHLPNDIIMKLKILSATSGKSIKSLIIEAIKEKYQE